MKNFITPAYVSTNKKVVGSFKALVDRNFAYLQWLFRLQPVFEVLVDRNMLSLGLLCRLQSFRSVSRRNVSFSFFFQVTKTPNDVADSEINKPSMGGTAAAPY